MDEALKTEELKAEEAAAVAPGLRPNGQPDTAQSGKAGNRNARKHGHWTRKLKLTDVSLKDISRQNGIGKAIVQKRESIIADRGGRGTLSELQLDLVDRYVKTDLLIHSIDQWLFTQKSLINRRRKSAYPILAERNRLVETSLKLAAAIGLERKARPAVSSCPVCQGNVFEQGGSLMCATCAKFPTLCTCVKAEESSS